ncbi:MAG TPA: NADH-quinone oxidoreductase subunit C [Acidimicrobiia bacterium]|nr:NADH-quinone oxidoreductase subunit C [Acidimicrobiia bacterium]
MTSSPPEAEAAEETQAAEEAEAPHPLTGYADSVAEAVGGEAVITFDTIKVSVPAERWVEALTVARDQFQLVLFSFLSAIDWSNEPAVGDALEESLDEEFFEVIATLGDVTEGRRVTFSTRIPHDTPVLDSVIDVFVGADWHEREAHEMFGIDFRGHPDLSHLYLPDGFLGNPLRKSFPLLSREVKPWPGKVDVEVMPETEEEEGEEAADEESADTSGEEA